MLNGRKSLVTLIAGAAVATTVAMLPSGTAEAKPTIQDVQHRVDRLYHAAEQASERYNAIHVQLKQMRLWSPVVRSRASRRHSPTR